MPINKAPYQGGFVVVQITNNVGFSLRPKHEMKTQVLYILDNPQCFKYYEYMTKIRLVSILFLIYGLLNLYNGIVGSLALSVTKDMYGSVDEAMQQNPDQTQNVSGQYEWISTYVSYDQILTISMFFMIVIGVLSCAVFYYLPKKRKWTWYTVTVLASLNLFQSIVAFAGGNVGYDIFSILAFFIFSVGMSGFILWVMISERKQFGISS